MKFIDEAKIQVMAGRGGDGCLSFRREKFIAKGGPNGGDGGSGGSVYLQAKSELTTLVDFRHQRHYRAQSGGHGEGSDCTGKSGEDLYILVPIGTEVYTNSGQELLGDLTKAGQNLLVARGGRHGLGNTRFKSSTNRTPRRITKGEPGEQRDLYLQLKLLADIGLLGFPNAGKSTLIRAVSSAKPKVADYPFTTRHPHLGVVRVDTHRHFVMADIPGLIEGAAEGAGLGLQFLRHLMRTRLLLHVIDVAPCDGSDPLNAAKQLIEELEQFDTALANKERWLVLNKVDLLDAEQLEEVRNRLLQGLAWEEPVLHISALKREGTELLCQRLMDELENPGHIMA